MDGAKTTGWVLEKQSLWLSSFYDEDSLGAYAPGIPY
jgi:hypothetical protein